MAKTKIEYITDLTPKESNIISKIVELHMIKVMFPDECRKTSLPCIISFDYKQKSNYIFTACGGKNIVIHGLNSLKRVLNKKSIYTYELGYAVE